MARRTGVLRTTLKNLLARKVRLTLSAFAVVLGVAFVSGTLILTDTLRRTFDRLVDDGTRAISVEVRGRTALSTRSQDERPPVPAALVGTLRSVPGVKEAVGSADGYAQVVDPVTKKAVNDGALAFGFNWEDSPLIGESLVQGDPPRQPGDIAVDKTTFDDHHLRLGQPVSVLTSQAPASYRITGVLGADELTQAGASLTAFTTPVAQRVLLGRPDAFGSIELAAAPGLSQEELRRRVARVLPADTEAVTGEAVAAEASGEVHGAIGSVTSFLLVFAGISVFVGAFIIFNTFTMLVGQRVRELALLRALGASRRQIRRSVLLEAGVIGTVGATLGLAFGLLLALGLKALFGAFGADLPTDNLVITPRTVIVVYLTGILVTSAAALVPARKAGRVPPVAAVRDSYVLPTRSLRLRALVGGITTVVGAGARVSALTSGGGDEQGVGGGAALCFLGVAAISPLLARPVTRVLGAPLPRLRGAVGRLGHQNAMRDPRRTAATASALMIGLAVVSAFAVLGASVKESTRDTVRTSLGADYILSADNLSSGFSPEVATSLRGRPGIAGATPLRFGEAKVGDEDSAVAAGDPATLPGVLALRGVEGDLGGLRNGTMLVDDGTATILELRVGQRVPVVFPRGGRREVTIAGTYKRNDIAGEFLISLEDFAEHYSDPLDGAVLVKRDAGADPAAVRATIEKAVAAYPNIDVQDRAEFVEQAGKDVDESLRFIYVLLALAIVIASFGIVNTLALSVIERTPEIGLLRAVGMHRRQLRSMIRLEAIVIAVFGAVLGVALGGFFGWALVSALTVQGSAVFTFPVLTILVVLVVAALLGVVAAVFPARRAAKMDPLTAISSI